MSRWVQVYVMPPAVFVSVIMGGGYGTGREVVEYFSRHGQSEGLLGILVASLVFAIVFALTFDFARRMGSYEYREFFRHLIGPFWWTFEVLYLLLFLLVLAVLSSAAGSILSTRFAIPQHLGLIMMLAVVAAMVFFGRAVLERILTGWMFAMYGVFLLYFVIMLQQFVGGGLDVPLSAEAVPGALKGGALYALYNVALAPVLLFAVRGIETRKEAYLCGALTSGLIMLPAVMFHISFSLGLPHVLGEAVPVYWMIEQYAPSWMLPVYLIALLGTLAQTGAGLVQGVIERVEFALMPDRDDGMGHWPRALLAVTALGVSAAFASLGIISLIARGYSAMAVGFAIVYVAPLLMLSYSKTRRHP
ncbi:YkvI family membrane protein [Congregibacter litoralis]|uniref:Putative membrane protein n=1 Tax=Congregibacter litoralis KT71 TaxID=314285 RepID=A4AE20_9GAMM|nr:membrane protein [Congregibacter litoralis]EAQ95768.1 putative membrane protein [Congregibacter litoralis KT71]